MAGRARVARMLGDSDLADELTGDFLVRYPEHPELSLVMAELLLEDRQLSAALNEAKVGLTGVPWSAWSHVTMGEILWELGRPDEALHEMQEALRLDPWHAAVRMRLTERLIEMQKPFDAVRVIGPLANQRPDDPDIAALFATARQGITPVERLRIRRDRARWIRRNRFRRR